MSQISPSPSSKFRTEYKCLSQNLWLCNFPNSKEHEALHRSFIELIRNMSKACNNINEVNICHLYSELQALALL